MMTQCKACDEWVKANGVCEYCGKHVDDPDDCAPALQERLERLKALLRRWIIWNGEDRHHDLLDESRRALEAK
jgi:hypothetical protein